MAVLLPATGTIALGELDERVNEFIDNKPKPQQLKVNKHYFRLYQIGFMVVEAIMLITLVYLLLFKPAIAYKE